MQTKFKDGSVMISGGITRIEQKKVGEKETSLADIGVAIGKREDGSAIYANVKAWARLAEATKNAQTGDSICVIGRIETREYNGKTYTDVIAEWLNASSVATFTAPKATPPTTGAFIEDDEEDEELPF